MSKHRNTIEVRNGKILGAFCANDSSALALRDFGSWRSEPFELNVGRSRKHVPLAFTVTANELGVAIGASAR